MFKHPTPEDFFRTMEDASAVDLDWFWRGWFYSTDYVDIGVSDVKKYSLSDKPGPKVNEMLEAYGMTLEDLPPMVFMAEKDSLQENNVKIENSPVLKEYFEENPSNETVTSPKYIYEIEFDKPGGLVMPLIVEYSYADGSVERVTYPPQVWRKNEASVRKVVATEKELIGVVVDPDLETADIDTSNNSWPKEETTSDFDKFKEKLKG